MTGHETVSRALRGIFRLGRTSLGLALVLAACTTTSYAGSPYSGVKTTTCPPPVHSGGPGGAVPEIDPSSIAGALTLLSGGALLLADKFRRK